MREKLTSFDSLAWRHLVVITLVSYHLTSCWQHAHTHTLRLSTSSHVQGYFSPVTPLPFCEIQFFFVVQSDKSEGWCCKGSMMSLVRRTGGVECVQRGAEAHLSCEKLTKICGWNIFIGKHSLISGGLTAAGRRRPKPHWLQKFWYMGLL